jgi:hypothetical protein
VKRGETVQAAVEEFRRTHDLGSKRSSEELERKSAHRTRPWSVCRKSMERQPPINKDDEGASAVTDGPPIEQKDERVARPASASLGNGLA